VEIFARCLGATAASGALRDGPGDALYGLGFIRDPVMQVDDKKWATKILAMTFGKLAEKLFDRIPNESKRHTAVKDAFASLGADMKAPAIVWNPARGVFVSKEPLPSAKAKFLLPFLSADAELPKLIHEGNTSSDLISSLQSAK
jgi:hypothetical protein